MILNRNHGGFKFICCAVLVLLAMNLLLVDYLSARPQSRAQSFSRGDALRLTIWQPWRLNDGKNESLDLNGEYTIDSQGYVFIPVIGQVRVVGHNTDTLAKALKEKFSPFFQDPVIIVEPLIRVSMQGAFNRPGTYLVKPDASLWELVDLAGGPSDNSNLKKMWVERSGRVVNNSLLGSFEKGYSLQEIGIQSGDQILAPERGRFGVKDAFEILKFGISLLNLYVVIQRLN